MTWHGVLLRGSFQPSALCRALHGGGRLMAGPRPTRTTQKWVRLPRQAVATHVNWPLPGRPSRAGRDNSNPQGAQGEHA
ncbi:hypothetical protein CBM2633_B11061 [Cupriavidus taiwanensis]|nr:hypothetical protein CBM2633_B11061 [Cupriavidus taiwanensis]